MKSAGHLAERLWRGCSLPSLMGCCGAMRCAGVPDSPVKFHVPAPDLPSSPFPTRLCKPVSGLELLACTFQTAWTGHSWLCGFYEPPSHFGLELQCCAFAGGWVCLHTPWLDRHAADCHPWSSQCAPDRGCLPLNIQVEQHLTRCLFSRTGYTGLGATGLADGTLPSLFLPRHHWRSSEDQISNH
jgi:hypothetical protein